MEKLLELKKVNKRFGGVVTALDVDMAVGAGEIHGLIGPNGAGKTTLLNLISGLSPVDSGAIEFIGKDITSLPAHKRARMGIARTFQQPRFLERSDIEENMLLSNDVAKPMNFVKSFVSKKDNGYIHELDALAKVAGFRFSLEDDMTSLTYGQKKLLEIIRSLLTHPKLILVDEPAAGLNRVEIDNAVKLLQIAARERGIGIVLIEHAMDMIMNVCDNITVLNFGQVIACGTPEVVSANEDVIAAYLGSEKHA